MSESTAIDPDWFFRPGTEGYAAATRPHNGVSTQRPSVVARPRDDRQVGEAIRRAAATGLVVVPQATGHGAGVDLGPDVLLLDTSGLDSVAVDPDRRTARIGAGTTWAAVQAAAEPHGLAGLAGSAPSVAVSGYTFGGGIGWFVRPYGTAAASLLRVEYVDGAGERRTAAPDAAESRDRDAFGVFQGGSGLGVATALVIRLHPIGDLFAGYLLWHGTVLDDVVAAWVGAVEHLDAAVSAHVSLLQTPPGPPFPPELQGTAVTHIAFASTAGEAAAAPLLDALRAVAAPVVDTAGPADLNRLGTVHLDPPPGAAAFGSGRWLTGASAETATAILRVAAEQPFAMAEIRHVAGGEGCQGPFLAHAVVPARPDVDRSRADEALRRFEEACAPVDSGRALASWAEGAVAVPDALTPEQQVLARSAAAAVDPAGVIARPRAQRTVAA